MGICGVGPNARRSCGAEPVACGESECLEITNGHGMFRTVPGQTGWPLVSTNVGSHGGAGGGGGGGLGEGGGMELIHLERVTPIPPPTPGSFFFYVLFFLLFSFLLYKTKVL